MPRKKTPTPAFDPAELLPGDGFTDPDTADLFPGDGGTLAEEDEPRFRAGASSARQKWKVRLLKNPVAGFTHEGRLTMTRPVDFHYKATEKGRGKFGLPDGWHTADALLSAYGIEADQIQVGGDNPLFFRRKRPRTDVTARLYHALVVEAHDEHQARAIYQSLTGVRHADAGNWRIQPAGPDAPLGPCDPHEKGRRAAKGARRSTRNDGPDGTPARRRL